MQTIARLWIGKIGFMLTATNKRETIMRKIFLALGGVAVVAVAAGVVLTSNLDSEVKLVIEQVGTRVAGVPVTVRKVTISLKEGKAAIDGLSIANPPGFKSPTAMSLGQIAVQLDPAHLTSKPLEISDISIVAPQVTYELSGQGTNLDALKANVERFTAQHGGADRSAPASAAAGGDHQSNPLIIHHLAITQGQVALATPIPGLGASVKLGDITLHDLGKAEGGASPAQIAGQVLSSISNGALKAASSAISTDAVPNMVKGVLGGVQGLLGR